MARATVAAWLVLHCSMGAARAAGPPPPDAGAPGARARFEAALDLIGKDDGAAVARLVALADEAPGDEYADDALIEAAELLEQRLGRPDRARDLYARVVARYADSRLSVRARTRLAFLDASLRTGAEPLADYQRILGGFAARPPAESQRMMEALLRDHPDFALADRAMLWLGTLAARAGRTAEAEARFAEVERRFAGSEAAALAHKGRGDARLVAGHPLEARAIYRSLLPANGSPARFPIAEDGARLGLLACDRTLRRQAIFAASLAWLACYLVAGLWLSRPLRPLRLGPELAYYLPVAALFVGAALTEARPIAVATSLIAAGGAAVTFVATRAAARRLQHHRPPPLGWPLFALATAAAVLALMTAAVHATQLTDFVLETLKSGPDR